MSLFRLDASIMPATSASRALGDLVEQAWAQATPEPQVRRRDVGTSPIPADLWAAAVTEGFTPEAERTDLQRRGRALATALADELLEADALLLTVPLYNYGVSQHVKTWFDLAYADPRIGPGATGLAGTPAVLVTVLGGSYAPGTPKDGWDHSTGWLERALRDVWGLDLEVVQRDLTLAHANPAMAQLRPLADERQAAAEEQAAVAGERLARAMAGARA
ncbi:NAD(P)H-dependent oxidoreductase [Agrococcus sp. SGAir0287]|uniref:NAD(P)H-dependent oxidoreductase n=1 Tax=Agrococcus sp. SGAir0287 TaxID=2070347 RepID=UPI0010CD39A5|nr:NAD(P)H-dependent oxidoreductase [Agrococcus sp. SGAir0287]QCR19009.1 ACP phosphodiesterase [Agrococcus sp. SGAir0287]